MDAYTIRLRDTRIVVAVHIDPTTLDDVIPFIDAYTAMLTKLDDEMKSVASPRYYVLMDVSKLTVSLLQPKVSIITALTKMFITNGPISDRVLAGAAIIVGSAAVASTINNALQLVPDGVPTHVCDSKEAAKIWLKSLREKNSD